MVYWLKNVHCNIIVSNNKWAPIWSRLLDNLAQNKTHRQQVGWVAITSVDGAVRSRAAVGWVAIPSADGAVRSRAAVGPKTCVTWVIHSAWYNGKMFITKLLIDCNVKLNEKDANGRTPLHFKQLLLQILILVNLFLRSWCWWLLMLFAIPRRLWSSSADAWIALNNPVPTIFYPQVISTQRVSSNRKELRRHWRVNDHTPKTNPRTSEWINPREISAAQNSMKLFYLVQAETLYKTIFRETIKPNCYFCFCYHQNNLWLIMTDLSSICLSKANSVYNKRRPVIFYFFYF